MSNRAVNNLNLRDFTYVVSNLRPSDEEELQALLPVNTPRHEYAALLWQGASDGMGYSVYLDDNPEAVFGVGFGGSYATAVGWAYGTHRFKRCTPIISHFIWNKISHDLHSAGVMRLEARALSTHTFARNWLKKMGFHEDCELPYYGTKGESFYQYSLTLEDYNRRFSERLN